MSDTPSIEELRNIALQRIGRNVVNFQKMEAMLKFVLAFRELRGPLCDIQSQLEKRVALFAKMPMGRLVDEGADVLYSNADFPLEFSATEATFSLSFGLDGSKDEARMWKSTMMAVVKERNRLIHRMLVGFDPSSVESCEQLCAALDSQREDILQSYAHLESLVFAIRSSHKQFADKYAPNSAQNACESSNNA